MNLRKLVLAIAVVILFSTSALGQNAEDIIDGPGYYFPEGSVGYDTEIPMDRILCIKGQTDSGEQIECPKDEGWFTGFNGLMMDYGGAELKLERDIPEDGGWFLELGNYVLNAFPWASEPVPTTENGNEILEYTVKNDGFFVNGNPPINTLITTDEVKNSYLGGLYKTYKKEEAYFPPFQETAIELKHQGDQVGTVGPVRTYTGAEGPYLGVTAEETPLMATAVSKIIPGVDENDFPSELYQFEILQPDDHLISTENPDKGKVVLIDYNPADNIIDLFGADQIVKNLFGWTPVGSALNADLNEKTMLTGYRLTGDSFTYSQELNLNSEFVNEERTVRPSKNLNEGFQDPFAFNTEGGDCIPGDDENCNLAIKDFTSLTQSHTSVPDTAYLSAPCKGSCSLVDKGIRTGEAVGGDGKSFKPEHSVVLGWQYADTSNVNLCPSNPSGSTQEIYFSSITENCQMRDEVTLEGQPPFNKPPMDGSDSEWGAPKFHVCFEGAESMNGKVVYSPNDNPSQNPQNPTHDQFKCDASIGEWISVSTCNDGVDNDGNGKVDLEDPKCSSTDDQEREVPSCPDAVVGVLNQDLNGDGIISDVENQKAAFWGHNPEGTYENDFTDASPQDCSYDNIQLTPGFTNEQAISNPNKQGFVLSEAVPINPRDPDGNGDLLARKYYCSGNTPSSHPILSELADITYSENPNNIGYSEVVRKYLVAIQQGCGDLQYTDGWQDVQEMPMASVQVPEGLIPMGASEYVNDIYGYDPFKVESLREAEQDKFSTPANSQPMNTEERLEERGVNQSIASIYPLSTASSKDNVEEAWTVANRMAFYQDSVDSISIYDSEGIPMPPSSIKVFEGGFAPKCPPGEKWTKRGNEWTCDDQFYHFVMPDLDEEAAQEQEEIRISYPVRTIIDVVQQESTFEEAEITCWKGDEDAKPETPPDDQTRPDTTVDFSGDYGIGQLIDVKGDFLTNYTADEYTCNTTLVKDSSTGEVVGSSNWVNLWDAKTSEFFDENHITDYIGSTSLEYNLDKETCSGIYGIPCDLPTNISTKEDELGEDWLSGESKLESEDKQENDRLVNIWEAG